MRLPVVAALALTGVSSLHAQAIPDLGTATPLAGSWHYAATAGGSEATYSDVSGNTQLWVQCIRENRRLSIAKRASVAAPFVGVWTSSQTRSVPSAFNPGTGKLTIVFAASDPLLDAITSSRGRIAFTVGTQPPLVVPPWAEAARVIEDCRA